MVKEQFIEPGGGMWRENVLSAEVIEETLKLETTYQNLPESTTEEDREADKDEADAANALVSRIRKLLDLSA